MVFDSKFNFLNLVSQVKKSTRVHARDLYRICPFLELNTSVLLENALMSSRLDYCNSLFLSFTEFELRRLQLVQNSLYRVVTPQLKNSIGYQLDTGYNLKLVLLHIKFSPGSTSLPKRINPPLYLFTEIQGDVPPNSSSINPHF